MNTQSLPDYNTFNKFLEDNQFPFNAADCHGLITGIICVTDDTNSALTALLDLCSDELENPIDYKEAKIVLETLCNTTAIQLADTNFSFQLLLPDDDQALMQRSLGISAWCKSFISGLGEGGVKFESTYAKELQEIVADLVTISKVDTLGIKNTEEEEVSFTELVEYVCMGAITIYTDLRLENKNIIIQDAPQQVH